MARKSKNRLEGVSTTAANGEKDSDSPVSIRHEDFERATRMGKTKKTRKRRMEEDTDVDVDDFSDDEDSPVDDMHSEPHVNIQKRYRPAEGEMEDDEEEEEEEGDSTFTLDSDDEGVSDEDNSESADSLEEDSSASEDAYLDDVLAARARVVRRESPSGNYYDSSFYKSNIDFYTFPFQDEDSSFSSTKALSWMVCPCDTRTFFEDFFQSTVLVVRRNDSAYYGNIFSTGAMMTVLRENHLEYGINVNLEVYHKGVRTTQNGTGHAYPLTIAEAVRTGYSVQLTNPQAFHEPIWMLCDTLQETFHCFVGANTYLTPAGSAGSAPHRDDIDAFILQVEGRKYWKVWAPESPELELPLESSHHFTETELEKRKPAFKGWLEQGDLLYIPRGFIHQSKTDSKHHSLHVTVSCGRNWSYGNMLQTLLPDQLKGFIDNIPKSRKQLPPGLDKTLGRLMSKCGNFCKDFTPTAIDLMAREFMRTSLPPVLSPGEKQLSAWGNEAADIFNEKGDSRITKKSQAKFIRRHGQRIIFTTAEDAFVVHRMANSRVFEGREEQTFKLTPEEHVGWTMLMSMYPDWTDVHAIRMPKKEKCTFLEKLFNQGIIMVMTP